MINFVPNLWSRFAASSCSWPRSCLERRKMSFKAPSCRSQWQEGRSGRQLGKSWTKRTRYFGTWAQRQDDIGDPKSPIDLEVIVIVAKDVMCMSPGSQYQGASLRTILWLPRLLSIWAGEIPVDLSNHSRWPITLSAQLFDLPIWPIRYIIEFAQILDLSLNHLITGGGLEDGERDSRSLFELLQRQRQRQNDSSGLFELFVDWDERSSQNQQQSAQARPHPFQ